MFSRTVSSKNLVFFRRDVSLSAVVLLDDGLKTKTSASVKQTLMAIAGAFSESDEVAVGRFDAYYTPVLDFTTDNDKLITALKDVDLESVRIPGPGPEADDRWAERSAVTGAGCPRSPNKPLQRAQSTRSTLTTPYTPPRRAARPRPRTPQGDRDRLRRRESREQRLQLRGTLKLLLSSDISVYPIGLDRRYSCAARPIFPTTRTRPAATSTTPRTSRICRTLRAGVRGGAPPVHPRLSIPRHRSRQGLPLDRSPHPASRAEPARSRRLLPRSAPVTFVSPRPLAAGLAE